MPGLLDRSEKFEFDETENQTLRHGSACANRVAKSNSLVGRHFDGPFAADRLAGAVDCYPGEPDEKPGAGSGTVSEMSNGGGEIRGSRNCILFGNKARNARVS
jgi:hypothetical protein